MAQSVELLTLHFNSGHDLRVVGSSPMSGSVLCEESAGDYLSPSLCFSPLKINKYNLKKKKKLAVSRDTLSTSNWSSTVFTLLLIVIAIHVRKYYLLSRFYR